MSSRYLQPSPSRQTERAIYEPIVPAPSESFVWRRDSYPLPWCVWNYHSECEVHLILRSSGTCYVGDHIGSFSPGALYLIGKDLPHNWVTPLPEAEVVVDRDVVIQFEQDRLLAAGGTLPEMRFARHLLRRAARGMAFHGRTRRDGADMVEAIGVATGLARLSLFLRLLDFLAASDEYTLLSSDTYTPNLDEDVNRILRDVLGLLASRSHDDVRLSDAADLAGMTETSFSRFFKRNTGNTFTRHLSELRVSKACQLLTETDRAVTVICGDVGYDNLSNFNRVFRELRGMSPRQYRRLAGARRATPTKAGQDDRQSAPGHSGQDNTGFGHGTR
jgi:AraC-like DNA-binding protein